MTLEPPPPDARALALVAALEELFDRNPCPAGADWDYEAYMRAAVLRAALKGLPGTVRVMAHLMRIPRDEVEAIIALIYG